MVLARPCRVGGRDADHHQPPRFRRTVTRLGRCPTARRLRFLWEALILDRNAPYARLWTDRERAIVADALAQTDARFAAEG